MPHPKLPEQCEERCDEQAPDRGGDPHQQHDGSREPGDDLDTLHDLQRRLRVTLRVPAPHELRLPPKRHGFTEGCLHRNRGHLRHEFLDGAIVVVCELEPFAHGVLDKPLACSKSRSLRLARNSSTLMLRVPTPSDDAISWWVSPSTYASHNSARSRALSSAK